MPMGGSSGSTTSTTTASPWDAQQPYLKNLFNYVQQGLTKPTFNVGGAPASPASAPIMGGGGSVGSLQDFMKAHPGLGAGAATWQWQQAKNTAAAQPASPAAGTPSASGAGFLFPNTSVSPETQLAQNLTEHRALAGSPVENSANALLSGTLNGDYLNNDPGLASQLDQVQGRINSQFAKSGTYGGSANQQLLARELGNVATQNYNDERQRQMQALLFAPQMANQDYFDIGQLQNIGAQKEAQAQMQQSAPLDALKNYMGLISGNYGGTSTQVNPYYSNPLLGGLGGAAGGASLAPLLGISGPQGALAGGLLGLLGGH